MSVLSIVAYGGAALIALLSAKFGRDPKQYHCVDGFSACVTAGRPKADCQEILHLCDKPKKEDEPRNRGEI